MGIFGWFNSKKKTASPVETKQNGATSAAAEPVNEPVDGASLHEAAYENDYQRIKSLIAKGCNVNETGVSGASALHVAVSLGHIETAQVLLKAGCRVDATDQHDLTPLHVAALHGYTGIIELLTVHDANINALDDNRMSPLYMAVLKGNYEAARMLAATGAEVNLKEIKGQSLLFSAVVKNAPDMVKLLVEHGADVREELNAGTLLHYAAQEGFADVAHVLCRAGADVNVKNFEGMTPLMFAVRDSHQQVVKVLLENHAAVDETERSGFTALQMAISRGCHDIVRDLLENGANVDHVVNGDSTLFLAVEKGDCRMVQLLIDKNPRIDAPSRDGWTPLLEAVAHGRDMVEALLSAGADANKATPAGYTPLMRAAGSGFDEIVTLLLDQGANVHAEDENGQTALDMAKAHQRSSTLRLLENHGVPKPERAGGKTLTDLLGNAWFVLPDDEELKQYDEAACRFADRLRSDAENEICAACQQEGGCGEGATAVVHVEGVADGGGTTFQSYAICRRCYDTHGPHGLIILGEEEQLKQMIVLDAEEGMETGDMEFDADALAEWTNLDVEAQRVILENLDHVTCINASIRKPVISTWKTRQCTLGDGGSFVVSWTCGVCEGNVSMTIAPNENGFKISGKQQVKLEVRQKFAGQ